MSEGRAVFLGFAAVLAAMIAPIAYAVFAMREPPPPRNMDSALAKAFLASDPVGPSTVPPDRILPAGLPLATAFEQLKLGGFTCQPVVRILTCRRTIVSLSGRDDWSVRLPSSDDKTLRSARAMRQTTSL